MPEEQIRTATSDTQYIFIGPPFNIGKLVRIGTEIPVALCEHAVAAPKKQYKLPVTKNGLSLTGMTLRTKN